MRRVKLSEMTFEMGLKKGASDFCMNYDAAENGLVVNSQHTLDIVRERLMSRYGDVNIIIDLDAQWYDVVRIDDERWEADHKAYCDRKQAWCDKHGCD